MSYTDAWRENRRLWKSFLLCWLGGPVVFALLSLLAGILGSVFLPLRSQKAVMDGLFWLVGLVWVLGTLLMGSRLFFGFRCPRCEKLFYTGRFGGNPYARRCLHCGLRKGTMEPPGA